MITSLTTLIRERIRQEGSLSFAEFMHLALYHPQWGYYSAGLQKFGQQGDFITAPELTPLFGKTLARQCAQITNTLNQPVIMEFGAGSGRLCVDILQYLEQINQLPEKYTILEVSGNLQQRQQKLVHEQLPHFAERVHWLSEWPSTEFNGVIIANEVLDAMPVHRFLQTEEGLMESFVCLNAKDELVETFLPCNNPDLKDQLPPVFPNNDLPYQSEVNLFINGWMQQCHDILAQGAMLIIDYGFPRREYYHPDRKLGTLMCHYQHRAHGNPFIHLGEQDITAHVDFTHVAEAAQQAGFDVAGYTNQAAFLLANGLLSLLEQINDSGLRLRAAQAVKQLIQPNEMGELFKVIALTKNLDLALNGFQMQDKRASL